MGLRSDPMRGSRGGRVSGPPLKITKNIGFHSNTCPDSLNNYKATKPASNGERNAI